MEKQIKNGIIHVHSEYSLKDSAQKIPSMIERAIELGAPAITLTDHHTLSGIEEAKTVVADMNKKYHSNLKLIPGVEVYLKDENSELNLRMHLILLPKNIIGYREISKALTESFNNIDSQKMAFMTMNILQKYFAKGSKGHDNVIATSACMVGPIASKILYNNAVNKEIGKFERKMDKYADPDAESYKKNVKIIEDIEKEVDSITEKINELTVISKKPYKKKEKAVESISGTPEYKDAKKALDAEKQETADAIIELKELKSKRTQLKAKQKKVKDFCKVDEEDHKKRKALAEQIEKLKSTLRSDDELYNEAKEYAIAFENIFGKDNFYIELQNHRIEQEIYSMPILAKIADELELPVVAANDAHLTDGTASSVKAREIMRSLRFNTWEEISESDKELYIKTDKELSSILKEIIPEETVDKAIDGIKKICEACDVEFKFEPHYPAFVSDIEGENAATRLRRLANEGIAWRYGDAWTKEHQARMEYELDVITRLGYCDYLCIVEDFLRYGRLLGKIDLNNPDPRYLADPYNMNVLEEITKDKVGLGIGPGRGSAVGSIVCYLVGITGLDPIKYDLLFERFLNVERVSMPDIDSDFKTDIRNKVLDYVKYKYGEGAVCCIMTRGTQKAKAAIRNCARLLGSQLYGDTKTFLSLGDEIAKAVPNELNIKLEDCWEILTEKFSSNKNAITILDNARLVEGVFTNIGMHAAGVIIADNGDVKEYTPLLYNSDKKQWCCQCDMVQAEANGLLKMDFLGLRNLNIITDTLRSIQKRYGKQIDMEKVPLEKEVFKNILCTGDTNSVFQFESSGMKQMLKQFQPENIEDTILLVAAYRPGPMQYLENIIAVKRGIKKPEYITPELEPILNKTYASIIYQEQVMEIFQKLAGYSLGGADLVRRAMSKKKFDKLAHERDAFIYGDKERGITGCEANGISADKANKLFDQMMDFAAYAFNKSHAAAYAHVAYYTAYLKYHYPIEYLCAVMNDTPFEKIGGLISDCRKNGINLLPPDINISGNGFEIENDAIVFGLGMVKNVGNSAEALISERITNGKYTSFGDFMIRTKCNKRVAESLIKAGAFDSFTTNRYALELSVSTYGEIIKKIKDKEKKIEEYKEKLLNLDKAKSTQENQKIRERTQRSFNKAKETLGELYLKLNEVPVDTSTSVNALEKLFNEKEMCGAYISAHPLDSYRTPKELGCTPIDLLNNGERASIVGIITNLRISNRKSDGKPMAFFKLEDITGEIEVTCFTTPYTKYSKFIKADAVIKIIGNCKEEERVVYSQSDEDSEDIEERILKFNAIEISPVKENKEAICLDVSSIVKWETDIRKKVEPYSQKDGYELYIYDCGSSKFRKATFTISKDILRDKSLNARIK